jgi:hypothetical protein
VQVNKGAYVRFRAGEAVQFGEGFRISDGGSMAVEVIATNSSRGRL